MKKTTIICLMLLGMGTWASIITPAWSNDKGKNDTPSVPTKGIVIEAQPYCVCVEEGTMSIISEEEKSVDVILIDNNTGTEESVDVNLMEGETIVMTNIPEGEYSIIINDNTEEIIIPTLTIEK